MGWDRKSNKGRHPAGIRIPASTAIPLIMINLRLDFRFRSTSIILLDVGRNLFSNTDGNVITELIQQTA